MIYRLAPWVAAAILALIVAAQAQFPGYTPVNSVQIGHGAAQPPGWDFVLGTMASQNANSVAITGGAISGMADPTAAQAVATKHYVDTSAAGLFPHAAVRLVTAAALPANVYNNGAAGVGATLTASGNGALSVDGVAVATNDRVLVKNEAAQVNNGIYGVTNTGSAGAAYVLTRSADANTIGNGANAISAGTYVFATAGATLINTAWVQASSLTALGTSPLTWNLFAAGGVSSLNNATGPLTLQGGPGIIVTTAAPNITITNTLPYYLANLTMSNDVTNPNTVIDITSGAATDSTNAVFMLPAALTKTTNLGCSPAPACQGWVAGSGNAAMGNLLTIGPSTWYHVCLANNAGTADYYFDTAANCSHRPAAITDPLYRRIGSFKTDSSSHIRAFVQTGDYFYQPATTVTGNNSGQAWALTATDAPSGVVLISMVQGLITSLAANTNIELDAAPGGAAVQFSVIRLAINNSSATANVVRNPPALVPTNTATQIYLQAQFSGTGTWTVENIGYIDRRGRDG